MEARSAAVAAAAAAATAYVEAQALSAAKHRAAARAKMEELTALSDAKLVQNRDVAAYETSYRKQPRGTSPPAAQRSIFAINHPH
jgi:hypothetical protein